MERFPLPSKIDFGHWIEGFKGLQNGEEVRSALLHRWQNAKHAEILRIGKRILNTWTPVGILQDRDTPFPLFNLVLFPICDKEESESRNYVEYHNDLPKVRGRTSGLLDEFEFYFIPMKFGVGGMFIRSYPGPRIGLSGEWKESEVFFTAPDGAPFIVSASTGRVASFQSDGTFVEIYANSLEEAILRILDFVTPFVMKRSY